MIELRSQINFRLTSECNIGLAITHMASSEEEAYEAGNHDARLVTAYLRGYGSAAEELTE